MSENKINPKEARRLLWEQGILTWKLHAAQKELYTSVHNTNEKVNVITCARRFGKTYLLAVMAIEECLKKPNTIVKFIAPKQKQIKTIIKPLVRDICADAPKACRPSFKAHEMSYVFDNGSEIQLAGSDSGNAESIRGGQTTICIVDEAGFCDDLEYIVNSILIPTTLHTNGKVILISTPAKSPDHPFMKFMERAEQQGNLIKKTIFDNPLLNVQQIDEQIRAYESQGGVNSIEFRREFLCERIIDDLDAIVPEFTEQIQAQTIKEWERPPSAHNYVAMDIGFTDLTVVLFGYHDFMTDKVIIEDEICINGPSMTTDKLAELIKQKETQLWFNKQVGETKKPYKRVSDHNPILLNDLYQKHDLLFLPTAKDDKMAALNTMRMMISQGKVVINPRCRTLITHLRNGIWNKKRTSFDRSADNGHYDAIDALIYLLRNIVYTANPFPKQAHAGNYHIPGTYTEDSKTARSFKDIFKIK